MSMKIEYTNATYGEILHILNSPGKVYLNFNTEYNTLVIQVNKSDMIAEIKAAAAKFETGLNTKSHISVFFDDRCPIYGKHTRFDTA